MKNQTLDDINAECVEAGKFLSDFTGESMDCIKIFNECQMIVQWIRDTTEGEQLYCNDLKYVHNKSVP